MQYSNCINVNQQWLCLLTEQCCIQVHLALWIASQTCCACHHAQDAACTALIKMACSSLSALSVLLDAAAHFSVVFKSQAGQLSLLCLVAKPRFQCSRWHQASRLRGHFASTTRHCMLLPHNVPFICEVPETQPAASICLRVQPWHCSASASSTDEQVVELKATSPQWQGDCQCALAGPTARHSPT